MMAQTKTCFLIGTLAAALAAGAETLVFAPEEGVTTNVTDRLTGDVSVSANPGASGGGTVRLTASYSDYTGTTANNCGYLWPEFLGFDSSYGSLGATTQLTLGPGTLKYTGQAGAISAPIVHSGANTDYSVYEIGEGSELTLKGKITSVARLVKTGAGTLRLAYEGDDTITLGGGERACDGVYRLELHENGDAPTGKGGGSVIAIVEGKVAIDSGSWQFTGDTPTRIGVYSVADTGTSVNNQEPSGTLEINGGTVHLGGLIDLAVDNGFTMNTPDGPTSSAFIINGGTVRNTSNIWFGRSYYGEGLVMNAHPRFEMHGGYYVQYPECHFCMGNRPGMISELLFDGGTFEATYSAFSGEWISGIITGDAQGDSSTTNIITIGGTASVTTGEILNQRDEVTFLRLNDDGEFYAGYFNNKAGYFSVEFNGGSLYCYFGSKRALISNNVSRVTVGAKGGLIGTMGKWQTQLAIVQKGIDPYPGLNGTDGGMTFASKHETSVVRLFGASTYCGPTTIGLGITELAGAGRLSPNSRLILNGGTLVITNVAQTVAGLTVGATATTTAETLKFTKTLPLTVTGSVSFLGTPTLSVVPLEADGSVSTTLGTYTVLTAPKAQKTILEALTTRCTAPNIAGAYFNVVVDGNLAKLVIQSTDPGLDPDDPHIGYWTASAGGPWMTAANWLYGRVATTYDMSAVFAVPSQAGGATVTLPADEVQVENLEIETGTYRVAAGTLHPLRMDVIETGDFEITGGDHVVEGTIWMGGGDEPNEGKLTVSGGSLTCDKLYMKYKTGTANAESSTLEISGGVLTAKTEVVMCYHVGTGTNRLIMTGGKLVAPSFKVGGEGGTSQQRPRTSVLNFTNCEVDLGTGTFNRNNSAECAGETYLGPGSVLRCGYFHATETAPSNPVKFDGGTFRPTKATSNRTTSGLNASYLFTAAITTKCMHVDMSELAVADGDIQDYVPIFFTIRNNPVYVSGGGCAYFDGDSHSFNCGEIVATNDSAIIAYSPTSSPKSNTIRIEPGAAFRFPNATMQYKYKVTLGRAGATEPARLEFNHTNAFCSTAPQFIANPLVVNSPVSVAWCTNGWKGVATCPDGVYTGIVYTTKNSVVDPANFVLPTYYQSWKALATEIIDYSETQKALVFTVTTTGEEPEPPEPPAPEPVVIDTLVVPSGDTVALDDGTTVSNLTIGAGSWSAPAVSGIFSVATTFALGLTPGEYASAKVSGDMTIERGCVWSVDVDDEIRKYDLLIVNGNLTIKKGAIVDFGRTESNPLPRHFRIPLAKVSGSCQVPYNIPVRGTGLDLARVGLTVSDGILYATWTPMGLVVFIE